MKNVSQPHSRFAVHKADGKAEPFPAGSAGVEAPLRHTQDTDDRKGSGADGAASYKALRRTQGGAGLADAAARGAEDARRPREQGAHRRHRAERTADIRRAAADGGIFRILADARAPRHRPEDAERALLPVHNGRGRFHARPRLRRRHPDGAHLPAGAADTRRIHAPGARPCSRCSTTSARRTS